MQVFARWIQIALINSEVAIVNFFSLYWGNFCFLQHFCDDSILKKIRTSRCFKPSTLFILSKGFREFFFPVYGLIGITGEKKGNTNRILRTNFLLELGQQAPHQLNLFIELFLRMWKDCVTSIPSFTSIWLKSHVNHSMASNSKRIREYTQTNQYFIQARRHIEKFVFENISNH